MRLGLKDRKLLLFRGGPWRLQAAPRDKLPWRERILWNGWCRGLLRVDRRNCRHCQGCRENRGSKHNNFLKAKWVLRTFLPAAKGAVHQLFHVGKTIRLATHFCCARGNRLHGCGAGLPVPRKLAARSAVISDQAFRRSAADSSVSTSLEAGSGRFAGGFVLLASLALPHAF